MQKSDLELYESRVWYAFAEGTPISELLPVKGTPEAQVADASAFDFFCLARYRGGKNPYLQWRDEASRPIVVMSPTLKFTLGPDFAFAARWALILYRPWTERRVFLDDLSDTDVQQTFHSWRDSEERPWYIREEYLAANRLRSRPGAGPSAKKQDEN